MASRRWLPPSLVILPIAVLLTSYCLPAFAVGSVTCISALIPDPQNGTFIPIHYPRIYDGTETFIGGPDPSSCKDLVGVSPSSESNWNGGGTPPRVASGRFWITNDLCLNVMLRGLHLWCCPNLIEPGEWSVTACSYTVP